MDTKIEPKMIAGILKQTGGPWSDIYHSDCAIKALKDYRTIFSVEPSGPANFPCPVCGIVV